MNWMSQPVHSSVSLSMTLVIRFAIRYRRYGWTSLCVIPSHSSGPNPPITDSFFFLIRFECRLTKNRKQQLNFHGMLSNMVVFSLFNDRFNTCSSSFLVVGHKKHVSPSTATHIHKITHSSWLRKNPPPLSLSSGVERKKGTEKCAKTAVGNSVIPALVSTQST